MLLQGNIELSLGERKASWRKRHLARLIPEGSQMGGEVVGWKRVFGAEGAVTARSWWDSVRSQEDVSASRRLSASPVAEVRLESQAGQASI